MVEAGARLVLGNHDAALTDPAADLNITARRAINWTRPRLDAAQTEFLTRQPLKLREDDLLFVHASAHDSADWIYVTSAARAMPSSVASSTPKRAMSSCGR